MAFEQHIDTEKLNSISSQLQTIKGNMNTKVGEINTLIKGIQNSAYASAESVQFQTAFDKFNNTTMNEFNNDMDAFSAFIVKVATTHQELAARLSQNIQTLDSSTTTVAGMFNK